MSVIIAVKDKDRFILGADKQASAGETKNHLATKIWRVPGFPEAIMGGVGSVRASQVTQYYPILNKNLLGPEGNIDTEDIVLNIIPTLVDNLIGNGVVEKPNSSNPDGNILTIPNAFLLAYKDRAWMIWNDLSVMEIEDSFAIGSGADVAKGVLFATKGQDPFKRITTCIDAAAETTLFVDDGIDFLPTIEKPDDLHKMMTALGIKEKPKKVFPKLKKGKKLLVE